MRALRQGLLALALVVTLPVALVGFLAGLVVAACERWLALVGDLASSVGWPGRRR